MVIFGLLVMGLLTVIAFGIFSLHINNQINMAMDLLSSTGGYFRTEQQQRQWWAITHNPTIRITDVHFVGVDASDLANMKKETGKSNDGVTQISIGEPMNTTTNKTRYITPDQVTIEGSNFDTIFNRAKKLHGGIAANGPTGVSVSKQTVNKRTEYTPVMPAHYGTSIKYTVKSRIPMLFFGPKKGKANYVNGNLVMQTPSLRGHDTFYGTQNVETASTQAIDNATAVLNAIANRDISKYVGFNTQGGNIDDTLWSDHDLDVQAKLKDIAKTYSDSMADAQSNQEVNAQFNKAISLMNNTLNTAYQQGKNNRLQLTGKAPEIVLADHNGKVISGNYDASQLPSTSQLKAQDLGKATS